MILATVSAAAMSNTASAQALEPFGGAAQAAGPTAPRMAGITQTVDPSYVLGPGDVIQVGIVGRDDFATHAPVGPDGKVQLPYVGGMTAANRSTLEFADDVKKALVAGGYFANPVVHVDVLGIASHYATVLGNVAQPGLIPLDRTYRLSELLARVGGRTGAGADYVLVTHASGGEPARYSIPELALSGPEHDPVIKAGDKLYVPSAEDEVFFLSGQVRSPGAYHYTSTMTLRTALARGGGITDDGSEGRITVMRRGSKVKVRLDETIQVGDVITVGERLF
jgi:polysaccharide export outer membrane protein